MYFRTGRARGRSHASGRAGYERAALDRTVGGMRRLCTICARGGSRDAPNKNLRPLMGIPLIAHTIMHARQCGLFERIAVSSDSSEILAVAKDFGADDLVDRPPAMATDTAAKIP